MKTLEIKISEIDNDGLGHEIERIYILTTKSNSNGLCDCYVHHENGSFHSTIDIDDRGLGLIQKVLCGFLHCFKGKGEE